MSAVERYLVGSPAPSVRTLFRPEWSSYWTLRALSEAERQQMDLDVEMLAWADERRSGR